jgi:cystathionine gamma-synthase
MATVIADFPRPTGAAIPPFTPHAISVSLPTWKDVVDYEEGDSRVVDSMECGYPRFFIHKLIQRVSSYVCVTGAVWYEWLTIYVQLAAVCEQKFASEDEKCLLTATATNAKECRSFIIQQSQVAGGAPVPVRLVQFLVGSAEDANTDTPPSPTTVPIALHVVIFPADAFPIAKLFWQHTGMGISSRLAERCLTILGELEQGSAVPASPTAARSFSKPSNRHYSTAKGVKATNATNGFARALNGSSSGPLSPVVKEIEGEGTPLELDSYLEERYGRNLPRSAAALAKRAMRRRIAGTLVRDSDWLAAGSQEATLGPSWRDQHVTEEDVFLFPTGMTAIWHAHKLARETGPAIKSVCFGYVLSFVRCSLTKLPYQISVHRYPEDPSEVGRRLSFPRKWP